MNPFRYLQAIGKLERQTDRERQHRRDADREHAEQIATLVAENERLCFCVAALAELLVAKGVLSEQEWLETMQRFQPSLPAENPFVDLDTPTRQGDQS